MEENQNINCIQNREKICSIKIISKENKFQITSVYISVNKEIEIEPESGKNINTFKEELKKLNGILTYEFIDEFQFILLVDKTKYKENYKKDIEERSFFLNTPIILIHLRDMETMYPTVYYELILTLKIEEKNNIFKIDINKAGKDTTFNFMKLKEDTYSIYYNDKEKNINKSLKTLLNYEL